MSYCMPTDVINGPSRVTFVKDNDVDLMRTNNPFNIVSKRKKNAYYYKKMDVCVYVCVEEEGVEEEEFIGLETCK